MISLYPYLSTKALTVLARGTDLAARYAWALLQYRRDGVWLVPSF
jgi:hypothetical protein